MIFEIIKYFTNIHIHILFSLLKTQNYIYNWVTKDEERIGQRIGRPKDMAEKGRPFCHIEHKNMYFFVNII